MSAEKSTEWLIDLLYEERDEEAATDAMSEESDLLPELDNAQQEELSAMLAMLGEVREAMPAQEPPARVRASILEAAHKQAEASTARVASSTGRRTPSGGRASTESLWSSRNQSRAMSFAAVLCVLIGAGVFASRMASSPQEMKFSDSSGGVAEQVIFDTEEATQVAQNEAPAPTNDQPGAMVAAAPTEENDFPNVDTNTLDKSLDQRDANKQTLAYKLEERKEDKKSLDDAFANTKTRSAKSVAKAPLDKSASKNSTRPFIGYGQDEVTNKETQDIENDYSLDSLGMKDKEIAEQTRSKRGSGSIFGGPESVARAEEKPAANKKMDSMAGNAMPSSVDRDYAPEPEMEAPEMDASTSAGEARTTSKSSRDDDDGIIKNWRARRNARKSKSSASAPKRETSYDSRSAEAPAEPAPTMKQAKTPRVQDDLMAEEKKDQAPSKPMASNNNTTLADVENAKRTEDADETLETADAFLARGIGTDRERARALELKAEALKELGRGEDARLVYQELESKYPTYYKKENVREKKKRAKRKSKASTDFADEAFEDVGF